MFKITLSDGVASVVARLGAHDRKYWDVSLAEIARDPYERFGQYAERTVPIRGFPWRTYNYWINAQSTPGGERILVFTAEYFDWRPVYFIDEAAQEVAVFSVRERSVYDPL